MVLYCSDPCTIQRYENWLCTGSHTIPGKATPSDTLVSGPETSLIACGRAAFLIMSLLVSPYESHYFANEYHYHTYFVPHDHSHAQ